MVSGFSSPVGLFPGKIQTNKKYTVLHLYSPATQKHLCWVLLRHLTQKIVLWRYLTQKIPTCWYLLSWVDFSRHLKQNPQCESVEYRGVGSQMQISCIGHVHFMLFVSVSFALDRQSKHSFQWNMGLSVYYFEIGKIGNISYL